MHECGKNFFVFAEILIKLSIERITRMRISFFSSFLPFLISLNCIVICIQFLERVCTCGWHFKDAEWWSEVVKAWYLDLDRANFGEKVVATVHIACRGQRCVARLQRKGIIWNPQTEYTNYREHVLCFSSFHYTCILVCIIVIRYLENVT